MAWTWSAELSPGATGDAEDLAGSGLRQQFESQAEAEAWLTENYEELADLGVEAVILFEEDRAVYGPMRLSEY